MKEITVGRFRLQGRIGAGGNAKVFKATDLNDGTPCCVKLLTDRAPVRPRTLERLRREAEALARVNHAGVVGVREFGVHEGTPFLAMELVDGESGEERLHTTGPFPIRAVTRIGVELAEALRACHAVQILHRDLKPANVVLGPDASVTLVDFGLAKLMAEEDLHQLTASGQMHGTPGFMSPELAGGQLDELSFPADVYGLGATLYAFLVGEAPIQGDSLIEVIVATTSEPPIEPRVARPEVPQWVNDLLMACLRKSPKHRPTLHEVLQTLQAGAPPPPAPRSHLPWLIGLGALVLLGLVGWGLALIAAADSSPDPLPPSTVSPSAAKIAEWISKGEALAESDDYVGALRCFDAALALNPRDPQALFGWGHAMESSNKPEEALESYTEALAAEPAPELRARILRARGTVFLIQGKLESAIPDLQAAVALDPEDAQAFANLASGLSHHGQHAAALDAADRSLELDPTNPTAFVIRARVHTRDDRLTAALADYDRAVSLVPNSVVLRLRRARHLADLKLRARALQEFDWIVERAPSNKNYRLERANLRSQVGNYAGAIDDYNELLATSSSSWKILEGLANCLSGAGQLAECIEVCTEVLESHNPRSVRAMAIRASALHRSGGDLGNALRDLDRALELVPNYTFAAAYRCKVLADLGQTGRALQGIDAVLAEQPTHTWSQAVRAYVLGALGRTDEARTAYGKVLAAKPIVSLRKICERELLALN